jgi:hypothetical protein
MIRALFENFRQFPRVSGKIQKTSKNRPPLKFNFKGGLLYVQMQNSNFLYTLGNPRKIQNLKGRYCSPRAKNSKICLIKLLAWSWSLVWRIFCWPSFKTQVGDRFGKLTPQDPRAQTYIGS